MSLEAGILDGDGDDMVVLDSGPALSHVKAAAHDRVVPAGYVGERGFVHAAVEWMEANGWPVEGMRSLLGPAGPLDPRSAHALDVAARDLRARLPCADAWGWGLFAPAPSARMVRAILPHATGAGRTTLLTSPTTVVAVGPQGLVLTRRQFTVTGWEHTDRALFVDTPQGQRVLGRASIAASMLGRLARGERSVRVRPVPAGELLAPMLDTIIAASHGPDTDCAGRAGAAQS